MKHSITDRINKKHTVYSLQLLTFWSLIAEGRSNEEWGLATQAKVCKLVGRHQRYAKIGGEVVRVGRQIFHISLKDIIFACSQINLCSYQQAY